MATNVKNFFSEEQIKLINACIIKAELGNTGEIRLHVEANCEDDPVKRATVLFHRLHMHKTKYRNAVLFYLAVNHKKLAVVGDKAIHEKVSDEFWHKVKDHVISRFKEAKYAEGLCEGIEMTGEMFSKYFKGDTKNQLPDEISFGN